MEGRKRYRLQRKERYYMRCVIGNKLYPLPTYRWRDIAVSDDEQALMEMVTDKKTMRVGHRYGQRGCRVVMIAKRRARREKERNEHAGMDGRRVHPES